MKNELIRISELRKELARIDSPKKAKALTDAAARLRAAYQLVGKSVEECNEVAEVYLLAYWKFGELLGQGSVGWPKGKKRISVIHDTYLDHDQTETGNKKQRWYARRFQEAIEQSEIPIYVQERTAEGKIASIEGCMMRLKDNRREEIATKRKANADAAAEIPNSDRWQVHHADLRTWTTDKQFDWIITDPPYPKEFLPLYLDLAKRANEWLKDGGLLVAMCGQSYLDEIMVALSMHLTYYWTAAYLTPGQPTPLRQVNVNTTWKPLLIFSKGEYTGKIFGDVFKSDGMDKDFHVWGQSLSGMVDIVSRLALPGESILDPFCGAGTTGLAALAHGCLFEGIELDLDTCRIARGRLHESAGTAIAV